MGKRLEIMMVGTYCMVGGLVLKSNCIATGIEVYGKEKWERLVRDIALGMASEKERRLVSRVVDDPLKPVFQLDGIDMRGRGFCLEVFHGGEYVPVDMVDAAMEAPDPKRYMRGCGSGDILAVFHARREGAISTRWDDVETFRQGEICLDHVDCKAILGGSTQLRMALNLTYRGNPGRRKVAKAVTRWSGFSHVLHKVT